MPEPSPDFQIAPLLGSIFDGATLDRDSAREVMGQLMDGNLSQMQAAALLAALRTRGETVEEIVGFAQAMRERAIKVPVSLTEPLLDTCGTGGTGISTINISTASLFIIAAAGVKIAKHGNRGVTRKSGAADVLEALGVDLDKSPEALADSIREVGLAFIYARSHHPAMKFVAPIRADLRARTIFNSLGPLTNPAGATRQLLGVYDPNITETLARVLAGLGVERAMVVHGDGIDELSVCGPSTVSELKADGEIVNYTFTPDEVGLSTYPLEHILGGAPQENASAIHSILNGEITGAKRDVILLNAGAALYLADQADSIGQGVDVATTLLDNGAAARKLDEYVAYSRA
ncbi:MAG: anthranilate phosphoribosyltransferase [Trueperaceae bacterium]|nr:anthranilate phosphoribosyltransferase [Trueperaceae bacterium]